MLATALTSPSAARATYKLSVLLDVTKVVLTAPHKSTPSFSFAIILQRQDWGATGMDFIY